MSFLLFFFLYKAITDCKFHRVVIKISSDLLKTELSKRAVHYSSHSLNHILGLLLFPKTSVKALTQTGARSHTAWEETLIFPGAGGTCSMATNTCTTHTFSDTRHLKYPKTDSGETLKHMPNFKWEYSPTLKFLLN